MIYSLDYILLKYTIDLLYHYINDNYFYKRSYQMRKEYQSNIKFIPNYYQNNVEVELYIFQRSLFLPFHNLRREPYTVNLYVFLLSTGYFPELLLCIWIATETFGNKLLYLFISWVSNWELMNVFTCHKCLLSPWQIKEHFIPFVFDLRWIFAIKKRI
jgi:hypothetical protein